VVVYRATGPGMTEHLRATIRRLVRALAWRATNCQSIGADITILCHCGKMMGLINVDTALHGQCHACGQHYSGAFYVRVSEEPLPWVRGKHEL
jgi:hypothetical protein